MKIILKYLVVAIELLLVALSVCLGVRPAHASMFEQVIHSFAPSSGGAVRPGPLLEGKDGALYGTTFSGGLTNGTLSRSGAGMVFRVNKGGTGFSVLHVFDPNRLEEGASPYCRLLEATDGALYGTTQVGGITNSQHSEGFGTVFRLKRDGSGFTVLYRFQGSFQSDGFQPRGLLEASDGALYGTTLSGGSRGGGTVFRIDKDGGNYGEVYSFGGIGEPHFLIQATDGALYGTTGQGCIGVCGHFVGDVFTLNTDGSGFNELYCFLGTCVGDGDLPTGLMEGRDGALYGSTFNSAGPVGTGETVFTLNKDGSAYNILHSFGAEAEDGFFLSGGVIEAGDGALYGTTILGGHTNQNAYFEAGTVYKLNKDGSGYSIVYVFAPLGSGDAAQPTSLILGSDEAFYGTSDLGGAYGGGTVFRLSSRPPPPVLQSVTRSGATLALGWSAFAGGNYQLQYTTNLLQTNWTNLDTTVTATNSTALASDNIGPDSRRFYRVVLLP